MLRTAPPPAGSLPLSERLQTPAEERANTWSAGAGLLLAVAALPLLAGLTLERDDDLAQFGAAAFGVSMIAVYAISTLYHALPRGPWKARVQVADRLSIYALIAGTYSPFALGPLRGAGGIWLFSLEWLLAAAGAAFVFLGGIRLRRLSIAFYLVMGWIGVAFYRPFIENVPKEALFWLLAGGLVYTAGVPFYAAKRLPFAHLVWHGMVIGGTACHYLAVLAVLR